MVYEIVSYEKLVELSTYIETLKKNPKIQAILYEEKDLENQKHHKKDKEGASEYPIKKGLTVREPLLMGIK